MPTANHDDSGSRKPTQDSLRPRDVPCIYSDVPPFMGVSHYHGALPQGLDLAVVGMPYDGIATFRGGATRRAPQEIRKYSLLFGEYHLDWDLDMFAHLHLADAGDVDVCPPDTAESYLRLEQRIADIRTAGAAPLTIGGDHGVTYPAVRAATADLESSTAGLIVFDTHLDLSEALAGDRLTRASPLKRIAELDTLNPQQIVVIGARGPRNLPEWPTLAQELGISVFTMEAVERDGIHAVTERARAIASMGGTRPIYISVDIDGVDPAFAPGTNSPEPGGLTSREIIRGVRLAAERGFCGFDVVEVSPDFDTASGTTSILAARLLVEAMAAVSANKAERTGCWR